MNAAEEENEDGHRYGEETRKVREIESEQKGTLTLRSQKPRRDEKQPA